jgi:PAS domain S-box-containing protein
LVNTQAERLFGYTRDELLGQPMEILIPHSLRRRHAEMCIDYQQTPYTRAMDSGRDLHGLRKDGTEVPIEIGLNPIDTAEGTQILASIIDVTERENLEAERAKYMAELQRSNSDLDQFAYIASHDLKAPLRAIQNLASWITKDAGALLPETSARHLGLLLARTQRMEKLLDDLLIYSRAGRMLGELDIVDIGALIEEVVELLSPGPGFIVEIMGTMPVVSTYRAPLRQLFTNLIDNAVKHHDRDVGAIYITCVRAGDTIDCCVQDDGPGIPEEHHERVFGMFQTLRPRDEVEGSGMGLAFVKRLVESQGGKIEIVRSERKRGTRFHFSWPVQAAPPEAA